MTVVERRVVAATTFEQNANGPIRERHVPRSKFENSNAFLFIPLFLFFVPPHPLHSMDSIYRCVKYCTRPTTRRTSNVSQLNMEMKSQTMFQLRVFLGFSLSVCVSVCLSLSQMEP